MKLFIFRLIVSKSKCNVCFVTRFRNLRIPNLMENILTAIFQKPDLMHLWPKFEKEKVDGKDIESLSDNELNNLVVTTTGDYEMNKERLLQVYPHC